MANALSNAVKKWIELSYKLYPSIHFFIPMPKTHQTIIIKKNHLYKRGKMLQIVQAQTAKMNYTPLASKVRLTTNHTRRFKWKKP